MNISRPRRILIIGAPSSGKLTLLKALTGSLPITALEAAAASISASTPSTSTTTTASSENADKLTTSRPSSRPSHAGLSHSWRVKTQYYSADIPIWIDEWPFPSSSPNPQSPLHAWSTAYHEPTSQPVLAVLGAFIYCFRKDRAMEEIREELDALAGIVRKCEETNRGGWEGVCIAVGMPSAADVVVSAGKEGVEGRKGEEKVEEEGEEEGLEDPLDDLCHTFNFEYIDYEADPVGATSITGKEVLRNVYGERIGTGRVREALEANDWTDVDGGGLGGVDGDGEDEFGELQGERDGDGEDVEDFGLGVEAGEFEREMMGLRLAIERGGGDGDESGFEGEEEEGGLGLDEEGRQVEEVEGLMRRMAALRDLGDDEASKRERRKLAASILSTILNSGDA